MTRRAFLLAIPGMALLARNANAQDLPIEPGGGASGGDALVLNGWDIRGVRNIQGGDPSNPPESLNLDIGAGSTDNPGDVVLNYDIGRNVLIYDGHKNEVARIGSSGVWFAQPPQIGAARRRARRHGRVRCLWWRWR